MEDIIPAEEMPQDISPEEAERGCIRECIHGSGALSVYAVVLNFQDGHRLKKVRLIKPAGIAYFYERREMVDGRFPIFRQVCHFPDLDMAIKWVQLHIDLDPPG